MLTLFVVGSIGFWILLTIEFILLLTFTELEKPGLSFFSLIVFGLLLKFFGAGDVFEWVWEHPREVLFGAGVYLAAGMVWGVVKWYFFVTKRRDEYLEEKEEFFKRRGTEDDWARSTLRMRFLNSKGELTPLARENKSRIIMWMAYWPWSLLWTTINDAVKRIYREIYQAIQRLLQGISDSVFKDVK